MKKAILIVLAASLLCSTLAMASGSSGSSGVPSASHDPYTVTEVMKCVITEIKPDGTVVVRDKKKETEHSLVFNFKTKFSAQDKAAFGGRKQLEAKDLKVGQQIKVTQRKVNGEVLRIKVLKS